MAKGDEYQIHVRGWTDPTKVVAKANGRKLVVEFNKESGINWLLVHEQTWTGRTVRTVRYRADDVVIVTSNFDQEG